MKKIIMISVFSFLCFLLGLSFSTTATFAAEETNENNLKVLLSSYYGDGTYKKDTKIYVDESKVKEDLEAYFHAEVMVMERSTYYTKDALWMSRDKETVDSTYSYYGTHYTDGVADGVTNATSESPLIAPETPNIVLFGDYKNSMEEYYVTLDDFIKGSHISSHTGDKTIALNEGWSVDENGVYLNETTDVLDGFRLFTAPLWLGKTKENANYISYTKATIQEVDSKLVMKLWVKADNVGVLVDDVESDAEGNLLFSEAIISAKCEVLGHSYSTNYVWSDDLSKVTATLVCANDSSHNHIEEVSTTYEVITESTTTVKGLGKYTAEFENSNFETQIKEVELELIATKTYYFVPGVWAENDATFGVRVLNALGAEEVFMPLTLGESGLYEFTCSVEFTHVCIYRFDSTGTVWWNGVDYMEIPENKDMFVITSWESYLWDEYLTVDTASEFEEGSTLYLQLNGDWSSAMSVSGFAVQFEGFNGQSDILAMKLVDSTNGIYKIVVPASGYIRVRFAQANPSNVYEIWNVSDYIYCDHDSTTNLIKLQNGWNSMVGNWTVYTE